jgi:MFS-type transporter involved in bile tolerance (Atg22 family)
MTLILAAVVWLLLSVPVALLVGGAARLRQTEPVRREDRWAA